MKKLLAILVLGLILFTTSADALTKFKKGQVYEGTVVYKGGLKINLPDGKWTMLGRWAWSVNAIDGNGITLAMVEDNILKGLVGILYVDTGGKWIGHVNNWLAEVLLVNKTDGCYQRSEYYLVERYKKGSAFNCLVIRHDDVMKEMYNPDRDDLKTSVYNQGFFRTWVKKNNIKVPMIMLSSNSYFYAQSVSHKVLGVGYGINPELYGASKTKFGAEETSEYHRANINRYPDKKKFMENWIKIAAQRHKSFEIVARAKEHHKLNLSKYGVTETIEKTKTTISSSGLTEELKELHDLYKEGVLTKEEFEKAKKKLLN